jgi:hypothetical protein
MVGVLIDYLPTVFKTLAKKNAAAAIIRIICVSDCYYLVKDDIPVVSDMCS